LSNCGTTPPARRRPLDLPVVVVPGADHFFHRRLHLIRDIITRAWRH